MNKTLAGTALAALCGAAAFATPAFAQTATGDNAPTMVTVTAQPATAVGTRTVEQRAVPAPGSRNCIRSTGSHIPPPPGQCLPVAGQSYSQEDLRRTGAFNVGRALEMLDPSITVGGH